MGVSLKRITLSGQNGFRFSEKFALTTAILIGAYFLRLLYPEIYMFDRDLAGHVMASMRLHLTFLNSPVLLENFFAQILLYNHGYTTILLPFSLYELIFSFLRVTITESRLVAVHSFFGILNLISIFYFIKINYGYRLAIFVLTLLSVTPIHIGLSRAHVGTQIIGSIFFYTSLSLLHKYSMEGRGVWKKLYLLATFFYIGSDNAFMIGLGLQIIYFFLLQKVATRQAKLKNTLNFFLSPSVLFTIAFPSLIYTATTFFSQQYNLDGGYLDRLVNKVYKQGLSIDFLKIPKWMFRLIGPITLPFFIATLSKSTYRDPKCLFLWILFGVYFMTLNLSSRIESNYVFLLIVPIATISGLLLSKWNSVSFLFISSTLVYAIMVVFGFPQRLPGTWNYGSIDYSNRHQDLGLKTLGYLIRTHKIPISRVRDGSTERAGLFLDQFEGIYYYTGINIHTAAELDVQNIALNKYETFLFAYFRDVQSEGNELLRETAKVLNLNLVAQILDRDQVVTDLFSNQKSDDIQLYQISTYNAAFDIEFGNLNRLPQLWLGHFGYKINKLPILRIKGLE